MRVNASKGTEITLEHCEVLDKQGNYFNNISSCIVSRAEEIFDNEMGVAFLKEWGVPENYIARCFVTLGYCDGPYPESNPRKQGRSKIIE